MFPDSIIDMSFMKRGRSRAQSLECIFSLRGKPAEQQSRKSSLTGVVDCEYLVHKACYGSVQTNLDVLESSPGREKKNKKSNFALLNKRQSSNDLLHQNGCKRSLDKTSKDHTGGAEQFFRRSSIAENISSLRPSSPPYFDMEDFNEIPESLEEVMSWRDEQLPGMSPRTYNIGELLSTRQRVLQSLGLLLDVHKKKAKSCGLVSSSESAILYPSALDDLFTHTLDFWDILRDLRDQKSPDTVHEMMVGKAICDYYINEQVRKAFSSLQYKASKLKTDTWYAEKLKEKFKPLNDYLMNHRLSNKSSHIDILESIARTTPQTIGLVRKLLENTDPLHPDYSAMVQAVKAVEGCAAAMDLGQLLQDYQSRFEVKGKCPKEFENFQLTGSSKRRCIRADKVQGSKGKGNTKAVKEAKKSEVILLLYTDYIVILKDRDNKVYLQCEEWPTIRVKDCLISHHHAGKRDHLAGEFGFTLVTNYANSTEQPSLYHFITTDDAKKRAWMRDIQQAIDKARTDGPVPQPSPVSSESEESDPESQRDRSITFEQDRHLPSSTPDSTRQLEGIEERSGDESEQEECDLMGDTASILRSLSPSVAPTRKDRAVLKGANPRRSISLHVSEKQKKVEENRRHTTCLSKEELNEAMSIQDNPIRHHQSADSGYVAEVEENSNSEEAHLTEMSLNSPDSVQDLLRSMMQLHQKVDRNSRTIRQLRDESQQKSEVIERQALEIRELRDRQAGMGEMSSKITGLEAEVAALRLHLSRLQPHTPRSRRGTYEPTDESMLSENPSTRV